MIVEKGVEQEESRLVKERSLTSGETTVVVLPQDGAMLSRFRVGKTDGFARTLPWKEIACDGRQAVLELQANDETRKQFSFEFGIGLKIKARKGLLDYQMVIVNHSCKTPMPIAPGLHPYFLVPIETKPDIQTNIPGFDPRAYDWKTPLMLPGQEVVEVQIPRQGTIIMRLSPQFKKLVVWSELDKPFVCLELFVGGENALLHPGERIDIPPRGEVDLSVKVQFH